MNRVLVTGGAGFIGSHVVDRLLAADHQVVVLDRAMSRNLEEAAHDSRLSFMAGDVRDLATVDAALKGAIDVAIHLSAIVGVRHYIADPLAVLDTNIVGTRNVVEAALRHGTKVVLASTSEIYGKNPKVPWAEEDDRVLGSTTTDRWAYSTSKAASEHMVMAMHRSKGLPATILRFFNVYGPRQAPDFAVSKSVYRCLRGEPPLLYDDGRQTRCFTFVDDAVAGLLLAASDPAADGEVFNIGSDREHAIGDVIGVVLRACGQDGAPQRFDTAAAYGPAYEDIPRRIPDVRKAKRVLGWEATTTLAIGVDRTVAWARAHPWWLEAAQAVSA